MRGPTLTVRKTGHHWLSMVVVAAFVASACGGDGQRSPTQPTGQADSAKSHLDALLQTMERYSIQKDSLDWTSLRSKVYAAAAGAQTIADTYPAISLALELLNDQSFYVRSTGQPIGSGPVGGCDATAASRPALPDDVGYVRVQGTSSGQTPEAMQSEIAAADRAGLAGWIVDLRGNGGGNMWPMIAGVGPVLGEGIMGWIVYNDREYEREYRNGAALSLNEAFASVARPYTLLHPYPRVAVLTDGSVTSAGEAIVVYFRGRSDTRSFGMPTCGHHHLLQDFRLGDGATLWLTTAQHADRTKQRYKSSITPDEVISDPAQVVDRALAWLRAGQ